MSNELESTYPFKHFRLSEYIAKPVDNVEVAGQLREGYIVIDTLSPKRESVFIDKNTFLNNFHHITQLPFGYALELIKLGYKLSRSSWAEGTWVCRIDSTLQVELDNHGLVDIEQYLALKNIDEELIVGWIPTTKDLLSNDWFVVNKEKVSQNENS